MNTHDPRAGASERVLARLNGRADTDITVVLRHQPAADVHAALVALATRPAFAALGIRARRLERVDRRYGTVRRIGPIDLAMPPDSPDTVVVRWSHLAGDAWSLQEFVAEALARAGLAAPGTACACATTWPAAPRPVTPADVWRELDMRLPSALGATWPAVAPLLRPVRSPLSSCTGPADPEAVAILELPPGAGGEPRASRFSRVVALTAALLTERACRLGITVDLRRHEVLGRSSGIGNASAVGYVNVRAGRDDGPRVDAKIRRLVSSRFWRQQAAFDAWLDTAPPSVADRVAAAVARHVASIAPVTVTELWRQDGLTCRQCGLPRRTLADEVDALAFPPALPPAGLTVGITRSLNRTTIVLRRAATALESATHWLQRLVRERAERLAAAGVTRVSVHSLARGFPVLP